MALSVIPTLGFFWFITVLAALARGEVSLSLSDRKCLENARPKVVLLSVFGCTVFGKGRYVL